MPTDSDGYRNPGMQNVQVRVRRMPSGPLAPEDFELVETPAPRPEAGQMLCRARWLSIEKRALSPSTAGRLPALVPARAVAEVLESRNDVYAAGTCVELEHGLQTLSVCDGPQVRALRPAQNPPSTALGILGLPGMAAYFGLIDLARLQPRDTVLVADAAGAAGSMAGQIAALRGARAIGVVSGRERAEWVTRNARFAACIDTAAEDLHRRLRALAPAGADIYFEDWAGGPLLGAVVAGAYLSTKARIVLGGSDAAGVAPRAAGAPEVLCIDPARYAHRREEFLREATPPYGEGLLVYREDVVEGLQCAPALACRLARGETFGQALVKA